MFLLSFSTRPCGRTVSSENLKTAKTADLRGGHPTNKCYLLTGCPDVVEDADLDLEMLVEVGGRVAGVVASCL